MLTRILEPELMDTADDAREYDAMDHSAVNAQFVTDLLATLTGWSLQRPVNAPQHASLAVLDLGAGTAQIPIELARRAPHVHITAVDAASTMLAVARKRRRARSSGRVSLIHADAKQLPFDSASIPVVISNSIVHHIAEPGLVIAEAIRVSAPGGLLFHRDLARPNDAAELPISWKPTPAMRHPTNRDSLPIRCAPHSHPRNARPRDQVRIRPDTVRMTSDRHWTWSSN